MSESQLDLVMRRSLNPARSENISAFNVLILNRKRLLRAKIQSLSREHLENPCRRESLFTENFSRNDRAQMEEDVSRKFIRRKTRSVFFSYDQQQRIYRLSRSPAIKETPEEKFRRFFALFSPEELERVA